MVKLPVYRSDMFRVHLSVTGVNLDSFSWDKFSGGDITPNSPGPYNPGGMGPSTAVGGIRKRSNATIQKAWNESLMGQFAALDDASGWATFTCSAQALKADRRTPVGPTITYTGILLTVTRPGYDSESSAVVFLQCELECDELVTVS